MNRLFKTLGAIVAIAFTVASCQKDNQASPTSVQESGDAFRPKITTISGSTECCTNGTEEYTTGWVDSADAVAGNWPPIFFDFCSGDFVSDTDPYHFVLHNRFNSYLTGASGWTLTYLNEATYPIANYSSITCIPTGSLNASTGNTMGMGKLNGTALPVPGWYNYNTITRSITPYRLMVLSNGTRHFLVYIESITPQENNGVSPVQYRAEIKLHYKCLIACS